MGWQDRSYYRDSNRGSGNPMMWLLNGTFPLFTAFGIRVRGHAMLVLGIVLLLILGTNVGRPFDRLIAAAALFLIVLLHEFGHCFAARWVGGTADEIILHPLGGVAFAAASRRPWPTFVTVAGGPLVNLVICAVCATTLWLAFDVHAWNVFSPTAIGEAWHKGAYDGGANWAWGVWVFWFHLTSWGLFLFNMMPIYPLDGGQMLQAILWPKFGYYKSMLFAAVTGIGGGCLLVLWGFMGAGFWMILIGVMSVLNCVQLRRMLLAEGPWAFQDEDGPDYSASLFNTSEPERAPKHRKLNRRVVKRAQKREAEERAEQDRVDDILAKVSAHGMGSLTYWEKRALKKATERQRRRDVDLKEEMTRKGF